MFERGKDKKNGAVWWRAFGVVGGGLFSCERVFYTQDKKAIADTLSNEILEISEWGEKCKICEI